jgi:hypothetical protein
MSNIEGLKALQKPFEVNEINKLPKPYKKDSPVSQCRECNGYHGQPALHLDYVGHAALTKRLLEVDPLWSWQPLAFDDNGLPKFDLLGGLWGKLTILGVERIGYGDAQGKTGPNAVKEAIGDFLRNAGMRFGIALDLWHKGDLYAAQVEQGDEKVIAKPEVKPLLIAVPTYSEEQVALAGDLIIETAGKTDLIELRAFYEKYKDLADVPVGKKTLKSAVTTQKNLIEKSNAGKN